MKKFPSPIIMKHPSGIVKIFNRAGTTILSFFFGCFYYGIIGLWSFVGWHLLILASFFVLPNHDSNVYFGGIFYFIWLICFFGLPFIAYQTRCRSLYEQGFRMVDKDGNLIDSWLLICCKSTIEFICLSKEVRGPCIAHAHTQLFPRHRERPWVGWRSRHHTTQYAHDWIASLRSARKDARGSKGAL